MRNLTYFLLAGFSCAANTFEKQNELLDIERGKIYKMKDCGKSCGVGNQCANITVDGCDKKYTMCGSYSINRKCLDSASCQTDYNKQRVLIAGTDPQLYVTTKCDDKNFTPVQFAKSKQIWITAIKKMAKCPPACAADEVCHDLLVFDGVKSDDYKRCVKKSTCTQDEKTKAWNCKNGDYYVVEEAKQHYTGGIANRDSREDCATDGQCTKSTEVCQDFTISDPNSKWSKKQCAKKTDCGWKEGSISGTMYNAKRRCYTDAETKAAKVAADLKKAEAALALWQKTTKALAACGEGCKGGQTCGTYGVVGDVAAPKWKMEACVPSSDCNKEKAIVGTAKKNKIYCEGMKLLATTVAALAAITYSM